MTLLLAGLTLGSPVPGHAGKLVIGVLGKSSTPVILMVGRAQ